MACRSADVEAGTATALALAANPSRIAAAWVYAAPREDGEDASGVRVATFNEDLSLVHQECLQVAQGTRQLAILPNPTGWMLALDSQNADYDGWVYLVLLDESGRALSGPTYSKHVGWSSRGVKVDLVQGPPGRSLLLINVVGGETTAVLLNDRGVPQWEIALPPADEAGAVFGSDHFVYAFARDRKLSTAVIKLEGTIDNLQRHSEPAGDFRVFYDEARSFVVWMAGIPMTGDSATYWSELDGGGRLGNPPVILERGRFNHVDILGVSIHGRTLLLMPRVSDEWYASEVNAVSEALLTTVNGIGSILDERFSLSLEPNPTRSYNLVKQGENAVVGWLADGIPTGGMFTTDTSRRLYLAKIR